MDNARACPWSELRLWDEEPEFQLLRLEAELRGGFSTESLLGAPVKFQRVEVSEEERPSMVSRLVEEGRELDRYRLYLEELGDSLLRAVRDFQLKRLTEETSLSCGSSLALAPRVWRPRARRALRLNSRSPIATVP